MNEGKAMTPEQIEAAAKALREYQMQGRITVEWDRVPKGQRKKWIDLASVAINAALDKAEARKVKALVWEPWEHGDFRAESIFGFYHIWGGGLWRAPNHLGGVWSDNPKAAAQADYETRILSALEAGQ